MALVQFIPSPLSPNTKKASLNEAMEPVDRRRDNNRFNALLEYIEEIESDSSVSEGEENLFTYHIKKTPTRGTITNSEPRVTRDKNLAQEAI